MSNWQITHTIDTLTMVNNKFDILKKINDLINDGVEKKNIFITDKSFLITTNYKTYFEKGNVLENTPSAITKVANIGRFITMEYNDEIIKINCLFSYYKKINSLLNKDLNCRLRGTYLLKSYNELFKGGIEKAFDCLARSAKQQVMDIYERFLSPDNKKMNKLLEKIDSEKTKGLNKNYLNFQKLADDSIKRFALSFNRFDRPILGIYIEKNHTFEIINSDQMYKNGEESESRIQLKNISKNSPVLLVLLVTGVMLGFISYLAYRDHKVNNADIEDNMLDMPQSTHEVIRNVLINETGEMVYADQYTTKELDAQVANLAEKNLNKLEVVTNRKKVNIEIRNNI